MPEVPVNESLSIEPECARPFAARHRPVILALWVGLIAVAVWLFVFKREATQETLRQAMSTSIFFAGFLYLFLGGIRGFTMLPAAPLLMLGVAFFPPVLLFVLTLAGILISAAIMYWFSESLRLEEVFSVRYAKVMERLKTMLRHRELPVITAWCLFPVTPTDLIVYVCGVLRISFWKCLLGVAIGAGINSAVVIFLGDYLFRLFGLK